MNVRSSWHATARKRPDGTWASLPPHIPQGCSGLYGDPCPDTYGECDHKHRTSQAALRCSRNRELAS